MSKTLEPRLKRVALETFSEQSFEFALSGEAFMVERREIGEDGKHRSARREMVTRPDQ
jgi:hypothetical protein